MGSLSQAFTLTMKLSVLALCFAAVSAEADPQLLYTVGAVAHVPTVKVVETPAEVKTSVVPYALTHPLLHGYGYAGLGYGYPYYPYGVLPLVGAAAAEEEAAPAVETERKKREAEAEADPWLVYSGLTHPYTYGGIYNTYAAPLTYAAHAAPLTYATHGLLGYHGLPYLLPAAPAADAAEGDGVEAERRKRDAEADPAVLASYSRLLTAPTPIYHPPARAALAYSYGYPYGGYVYGK